MKYKFRHFAIIGCGLSGSSLLQSILNKHSEVIVMFEQYSKSPDYFTLWIEEKYEHEKRGVTFGIKNPVEVLINNNWPEEKILEISDYFFVIWNLRKFSGYLDSAKRRSTFIHPKAKEFWDKSNELYWKVRERHPDKLLSLNFEELVTYPKREIIRMCDFLNIEFEPEMLDVKHNDKLRYSNGKILAEKAFI